MIYLRTVPNRRQLCPSWHIVHQGRPACRTPVGKEFETRTDPPPHTVVCTRCLLSVEATRRRTLPKK